MKVGNTPYRTIWLADDGWTVEIIDQTGLPHEFRTVQLTGLDDVARAIATMEVRGAPLIGATAAYGVCLALREDATDQGLKKACDVLRATRPTAVNLAWALAEMEKTIIKCPVNERVEAAYRRAAEICDEDVEMCRSIGEHGKTLISDAALAKGDGP
ncbi:MAG: S-methyl-5-thioribose-1-phosphate isomerase, partial [Rhodospirillales bacterium]|nr:S-methyl-5-thioribose-1-phosphate isomerase [Rhodospirillales bacterium]